MPTKLTIMKKRYTQLKGLLLVPCAIFLGLGTTYGENALPVLPRPVESKLSDGSFSFSANTVILAHKKNSELAKYTQDLLSSATGYPFTVKENSGRKSTQSDAIILQQTELSDDLGKEGYQLSVTGKGVLIRARSSCGHDAYQSLLF